ncbi:MAG: hypothetical protein ACRD0Q_06980 [Acidimicrobiales bacterium]
MNRVRISTTVDGERLAACRRLVAAPDSRLLDQALAALIEKVQTERELAILDALPYEADPELSWEAPPGPDLPYDGRVPGDVMRLAKARRRRG